MLKQIDLRGLTCPEPVLRTKRLLDDKELKEIEIEALVDGQVNVNNLERLARSLKLKFVSQADGHHFKVIIKRVMGEAVSQETIGSSTTVRPVQKGENKGIHDHGVDVAGLSSSAAARSSQDGTSEAVTVVFLGKDKFGDGDEEFSRTLTSIFLQTMYEAGHRPRAILLANTGVRLLAKNSSSHKVLSDFRSAGVEVLACGLCVEFYGLKDEIAVDQITNMFAICEYMFAADRMVTI